MNDSFPYDVFLSHSAKDKKIVRELAQRLKADGLNVWFDEWELKPGDSIQSKIEEGLESSRVLVLCVSKNAFGADWTKLESSTFRFRDPLNNLRRLVPLRLDDVCITGSLGQLHYVNWSPDHPVEEYAKLLDACVLKDDRPPNTECQDFSGDDGRVIIAHNDGIYAVGFSLDGRWAIADTVRRRLIKVPLDIHISLPRMPSSQRRADTSPLIRNIAFTPDGAHILTCSSSPTIEVYSLPELRKVREFNATNRPTCSVGISNDGQTVVAGSYDGTISAWNFATGKMRLRAQVDTSAIKSILIHKQIIFFGTEHGDLRALNIRHRALRENEIGTRRGVTAITRTPNGRFIITGSTDGMIWIWNANTNKCVGAFEGHTSRVFSLAVTKDGKYIVSGGYDRTVRLWDLETGQCLRVFRGHTKCVRSVNISPDDSIIASGSIDGTVRIWPLVRSRNLAPEAFTHYTNAKVLLVGDSGAGKTGLSKRLALNNWEPSDSTVGTWATQWKLPVDSDHGVEREIWLWDFGGQADQRLIHQLYMDETALAVLVFDGQKDDTFETLGQWDRDLTRSASEDCTKLLAAGRIDAGGLRVGRSQIEAFKNERGYREFLETSAKTNFGCEDLKKAILNGIRWENIPWRSSPILFKRLKEEIISLKDAGRVLMRFNELRDNFRLRLTRDDAKFTDEELKAVIALLAGPGVVWELKFGSWVLLQPERINAYAQAVIQTMLADVLERGCLLEEDVLKGELKYNSSIARLNGDEERFVLLAMHQMLVERGLCLRQPTVRGNLLIFPSYYRRERAEQVKFPSVLVSFRFTGFLDEIYATLVVRLHHSEAFEQDQLWRYAADFRTKLGKRLGVKLSRRAPGLGELEVYFDAAVSVEERIIFSKFIHEHLLQHGREVERLRHYACGHCGTAAGNRDVAMKRLSDWLQNCPPEPDATEWLNLGKTKKGMPSIVCVGCERRVPLWDDLEQCFASPEIRQRVRDMQEESKIVLDNESKERALVGEVISTVALAGQISRELTVSDHGIDMEIEFKDDCNEATAVKLYLQLKSGDSYLRKLKANGLEVFTIKDERHVRYWTAQKFPVLLVIRNSDGEVRWMEVRDYLQRESEGGKKLVKQIVFEGERFDVMSVRRWRDRTLKV